MSVDLSTSYLGLKLTNPLVASASPLTGDLNSIRKLEDAGAAAIVLPSLFEEQIERVVRDVFQPHDPGKKTKPVSIIQVIGDQDKSFNGSSNPKVTMYSATERIDVWRTFNRCRPDPVVVEKGEEMVVYTYANQSGIEVAFCKVKDQEHHIRRDLRDRADAIALDFLLKHKKR